MLADLRETWRRSLEAGPTVTAHEAEIRRYVIADRLDDLRDSTDQLEQHVIASTFFERTAKLVLLANRHWIGTGKYMPRRLRELSGEIADLLSAPLLSDDLPAFGREAELCLEHAGGRVHTGSSAEDRPADTRAVE